MFYMARRYESGLYIYCSSYLQEFKHYKFLQYKVFSSPSIIYTMQFFQYIDRIIIPSNIYWDYKIQMSEGKNDSDIEYEWF